MTTPKGLTGSRILVTGASRGIGLGVAAAMVEAGAQVWALAEDEAIFDAAADIGATGLRADVTDPQAVAAALARAGPLDVLVNNAGLERLTPLDDTSPEAVALFRRILDINVTGMAIVTGQAVAEMRPGARIVNTASIWGRVGEPFFAAYVASKHAVIGVTKTWAAELGPSGIRVNAVAPGWVRTDAAIRSARTLAARSGTSEGEIIDAVAAAQPLAGGLMEPADIAGAFVFLASPASANITGQTLGIDRGEVPW
ncbi:SDR family NAD(P)-dependent oxidoreductase [Aquicoccus sp.]|uniref:SDR family NAD(P)-dependent oxidoreductase n=1 Tax=Aquicoccus sp. TaxID=2055851 RepID=UPI003563BC32